MKITAYPSWAPTNLVDEHMLRTNISARERLVHDFDPDQIMDKLVASEKYQAMDLKPTQTREMLASLYLDVRSLPERESTDLLGRLVTDIRMKSVWAAIRRRADDGEEYLRFWRACENGILEWRRDQKLSVSEQKDFLIRIHELASELSNMMRSSKYFHDYSSSKFMDKERIQTFLEQVNASPSGISDEEALLDHVRLWLSITMPNVPAVLSSLSIEAINLLHEEHHVKKPNSNNAPLHYFIRTLSKYCRGAYGQPLHELVGTTTAVIFDQENIDSDYVRKLV